MLFKELKKLADEKSDLRKHLVPLLKRHVEGSALRFPAWAKDNSHQGFLSSFFQRILQTKETRENHYRYEYDIDRSRLDSNSGIKLIFWETKDKFLGWVHIIPSKSLLLLGCNASAVVGHNNQIEEKHYKISNGARPLPAPVLMVRDFFKMKDIAVEKSRR